ncbi:26328_t:CDS:2 [Gigaspora margarita]|uniref:26328_t:CDS:1 n=1 Tax=Gigaspora margarita TaxID=4874 RepID=A0ABM8W4K3_GIGMA|nr:26328_t:CDS:2 [Gigaspora margarita]
MGDSKLIKNVKLNGVLVNAYTTPCYHIPTPPLLNLDFLLGDPDEKNHYQRNSLLRITQKSEYNVYNDTKLLAEIYSENNDQFQNIETEYTFELCTMTNISCPISAGNVYFATTNFFVPANVSIIGFSVLTEQNQYLGCEMFVFKNLSIPSFTTVPTNAPTP